MSTRKSHSISGFTLIEMVVVGGILVIISAIITGVLYTTLTSTSKSTILNTVSQNGNYALSVMTNIITSSDEILNVGNAQNFSDCTSNPSGTTIELHRTDGGITTLDCGNGTIASESAAGTFNLINDQKIQVVPGSCSFTCSQTNPYSVPIIKVSYTLENKSTSTFDENKASSTFNTSVAMRNYQ